MYNGMFIYRSSSGVTYEVQVTSEYKDVYIPLEVIEKQDGTLSDPSAQLSWPSLPAMTRDLLIEIVSIDSDPGN